MGTKPRSVWLRDPVLSRALYPLSFSLSKLTQIMEPCRNINMYLRKERSILTNLEIYFFKFPYNFYPFKNPVRGKSKLCTFTNFLHYILTRDFPFYRSPYSSYFGLSVFFSMSYTFVHIMLLSLEIFLEPTYVFQMIFIFITPGFFISVLFLLFPTSNNDLLLWWLNSF